MRPDEPLVNRSILVVDDERFTRALVARLLGYLGAKDITQAEDGAEALRLLEGGRTVFDAIIADLNMPHVNGLEMLKAIRSGAIGCPRDLPVIMLTGHSDIDLVSLAMALDINGFIVKPVSQGALAARLVRVFSEDDHRHVKAEADYAKVDVTLSFDDPEQEQSAARRAYPSMVRVALADVRPGAVLAKDITVPTGLVLIAAGTPLTMRLIQRLKDLGDLRIAVDHVWVAA